MSKISLSKQLKMPRQGHRGAIMEGRLVPTKIRKRGCSSSSSTSSRIRYYRLNKRAILVGKNRSGLSIGHGGSRSTTPVPVWRTTPLRSAFESPKYSQSAKSAQPVSARRLAATLWGMNNLPSRKMSESNLEMIKHQRKTDGVKTVSKGEKMQPGWGLHLGSRYLSPHLSDPSHSPTISECAKEEIMPVTLRLCASEDTVNVKFGQKMDLSGTGSHQRRTQSVSQRLRSADQNVGALDSISNASFMEIETRSRAPTSSGSVSGNRNRLKDASNALTTSKELLKIINRIWARADPPSSSMSLISALHAELERARLQVNQFIQEYCSDKREINHLIKCFAEEKASWKSKEQQAVESAVESIAGELEIERKLRRRLESLNKKLGKEFAEIKVSFLKAAKELESEKRAREITEQVCDELARNIDEERVEVEMLKRDSVKPFESNHQFEEKNSAIKKLRKQLEGFLGTKRDKEVENGMFLSKAKAGSHQNEQEEGNGIVEDLTESKEDSGDSDLHSIELNMDNNNNNKGYKWARASAVDRESRKLVVNDETMIRNSVSGHVAWRSGSIQRSVSDCVESAIQDASRPCLGEGVDRARYLLEKQAQNRSHLDDTYRHKSSKGLKDHALSSSKLPQARDYHSLSEQNEQSWSRCDPCTMIQEKSRAIQMTSSKSRMADARGESQSTRSSKC